jgi:MFS family permease
MASPNQKIDARLILTATVGNALEWFDFTVFAFFAGIISRHFFPTGNPFVALLATWTTFGVGFLTRPLGGIIIGNYADRHGRKSALLVTISVMALGVAIIACSPTYAQIGIGAPLLMLAARFLQGFSTGGEVGSATAFLVEHAPPERRGFYGSFQMVSQAVSMLLGALTSVAITQLLTPEQVESFGWRLPFAVGLLIVPVGLYIRAGLEESPVFKKDLASRAEKYSRPPFMEALASHWRQILVAFGLTIYSTICTYLFFYYMPTYATQSLGMPFRHGVIASLCAAVVCIIGTLTSGHLSDTVGRKKPMLLSAIANLVLAYPLFFLLTHAPTLPVLILAQCILMLFTSIFYGAYLALICEQFPAYVRATSVAIGYNFAVMIFGGFAGAIATLLLKLTGEKISVVYYGIFGALIGLITLWKIKDRTREPLL